MAEVEPERKRGFQRMEDYIVSQRCYMFKSGVQNRNEKDFNSYVTKVSL